MMLTQAARICSAKGAVQLTRASVRPVLASCKVVRTNRRATREVCLASNVEEKTQVSRQQGVELAAAGAAFLPFLAAAGPAAASPSELANIAELSGVIPVQNVLAAFCIIFIIIQGPKGEGMVNSMNESRMFNFSETRNFVTVLTWALIGGFLLFSALAALP